MKENSPFSSGPRRYSPGIPTARPSSSRHDSLDALIRFSNHHCHYRTRNTGSTSLETLSPLQDNLSGLTENCDLYKQQTGTLPDASMNTLPMNQQHEGELTCVLDGEDEFLDFQTAPAYDSTHNSSDIDLDFDSSNPDLTYFNPDPSNITLTDSNTTSYQHLYLLPSQGIENHHLWPGLDQQQSNAEIQHKSEPMKQCSEGETTPNRLLQNCSSSTKKLISAYKDPIVEQKFSQLLKSIREGNSEVDDIVDHTLGNLSSRSLGKKEAEMDEDERLLASEEGKKLSSKERRQLRNKVSARAFRSRRKEYINQLEDEIAMKINENGDLRAQNRALIEENIRLSDLTRMLISSPSFSGFVDALALNPMIESNVRASQQHSQKTDHAQSLQNKDINPHCIQQQKQHQYLGMAFLPESPVDFSTLDLNYEDNQTNQPRVFFVQNIPESFPDYATLSCKNRPLVLSIENKKVNFSQIECTAVLEYYESKDLTLIDENFKNESMTTLFNINSASSTSEISQPISDLTQTTQSTLKLVKKIESSFGNESSDPTIQKINRLLAETDACIKRLSSLI